MIDILLNTDFAKRNLLIPINIVRKHSKVKFVIGKDVVITQYLRVQQKRIIDDYLYPSVKHKYLSSHTIHATICTRYKANFHFLSSTNQLNHKLTQNNFLSLPMQRNCDRQTGCRGRQQITDAGGTAGFFYIPYRQ